MSGSELVPVEHDPRVALQREYEQALSLLSPAQKSYVENVLVSGDPRAAAAEAGFASVKDAVRRLRSNAAVARAVSLGRQLREAESPLPREGMIRLLEQMLATRIEDVLVVSPQGIPIDCKDWSALPLAAHRAVKRLTATTDRTALGDRAKLVKITVELWNPIEILRLLAQLRGDLAPDAPAVNIDIGQGSDVSIGAGESPGRLPRIVEELAEALWPDDGDLTDFIRMNDAAKLEVLRRRITELGAVARRLEDQAR
jgi:hypothetical protein